MDYRLLIDLEVYKFLERLPLKTRRAIRDVIEAIGQNPVGLSESQDQDEVGRLMQIATVGDYAIMYWIDEADCHLKILDVHSIDR